MTTISPKNYNNPMVTLDTNMGNIYLEIYKSKAPITANNFLSYCYKDFYNNTIFHRVIDNFMVQAGGYTARPFEEKKVDTPILLESKTGLHNFFGTVAMARTNEPNSATSQFFINLKHNFFLDYNSPKNPGYAVFANVLGGMEVAQTIAKVELFPESTQPLEDVIIESTEVTMFYKNSRDKYKIFHDGTVYVVTSGKSKQALTYIESIQFKDKKLWLSPSLGDVTGADTSDYILGNADNNVIDGGGGDDEINGLQGNNQLTGGMGNDLFIFTTTLSASSTNTITDFTSGMDRLVISKTILGKAYTSIPKNITNDFIAGIDPQPLDKTDHFLYDRQTGVLMFDADGSGLSEPVAIVTLVGQPNLLATDLLIQA